MVKAELFRRLREQGIEAAESDIILIVSSRHYQNSLFPDPSPPLWSGQNESHGKGTSRGQKSECEDDCQGKGKNKTHPNAKKMQILLKSAESSEIRWLGLYVPRGRPSSSLDQIKDTFDQILVDFGLRSTSVSPLKFSILIIVFSYVHPRPIVSLPYNFPVVSQPYTVRVPASSTYHNVIAKAVWYK